MGKAVVELRNEGDAGALTDHATEARLLNQLYGVVTYAPADGGTVTPDVGLGGVHVVTLPDGGSAGSNVTIGAATTSDAGASPPQWNAGQRLLIVLIQGTGVCRVTWDASWNFVGSVNLDLAAITSVEFVSTAASGAGGPTWRRAASPADHLGAAAIEARKGQAMARRVRSGYDPVTSRALGSMIQFQQWCKNSGWPAVSGFLGEIGVGNGTTAVSPGQLSESIEQYMAVAEAVMTYCDQVGLSTIYWDCTECTIEQNSMYGPDSFTYPGLTGPLAQKYPTAAILESHINNANNASGPFHAVAYKAGYEGAVSTQATTVADSNGKYFSNNPAHETRTFNVGPGIPVQTEYNYGRPESYEFLASNNVQYVRMSIRWERFQRSITSAADGGPLDPVEMKRLDDAVAAARANNVYVILDLHNELQYYLDDGTKGVRRGLGGGTITQAMLVGFWKKMASHFQTAAGVVDPVNSLDYPSTSDYLHYGRGDLHYTTAPVGGGMFAYELMNEPQLFTTDGVGLTELSTTENPVGHGRTAGTAANIWAEAANAAGQAIRAIDATIFFLVQPYGGGGAGPTFYKYHPDGPFMYASGPVAGGSGNTNFQSRTFYVAHLYFNGRMSGDYTTESFENNLKGRAGEGWMWRRQARAIGAHTLDGGTYYNRTMVSGTAGGPALQNIPAIGSSQVRDVYVSAGVPYGTPAPPASFLGVPGRLGCFSNMTFNGPSGQTVAIYVRPAVVVNGAAPYGSNAKHINWLRWIGTIPAGGSLTMNVPTWLNPGDCLVVECGPTAGGVTWIGNYHEWSDTELTLVQLPALAAATDAQVFQASDFTEPFKYNGAIITHPVIARVLHSQGGPPFAWGWWAFNISGLAWPVFNGTSEGAVPAANTITVQGKLQVGGAGTKYNLGAPVSIAAGVQAAGQGGLFPGVPIGPSEIALTSSDTLFITPSAAGLNAASLWEVRGQ